MSIPFQTIQWDNIPKEEHASEQGMSWWQTLQLPGLRLRLVEYSLGYLAGHWCRKGHIVHCLEGSFDSELATGEVFTLSQGQSYVVSDDAGSHRSTSKNGVKLLMIDGDFLG